MGATPIYKASPQIEKIIRNEYDFTCGNLYHYIHKYVKIEQKKLGEPVSPFILWESQEAALKLMVREKLVMALKARQLGVTWLTLTYASHKMIKMGFTVAAISKSEIDAQELVRRMGIILSNIPFISADGTKILKLEIYSMKIILTNEKGFTSTFTAFTSGKSVARSFTFDLLLLDEWAFQENADNIWRGAFATINRPEEAGQLNGQVIGISTNERGSLFESLWLDQENTFAKIFLPWSADPRRDAEWYDKTVKNQGKQKTMEEYPATEEEAFLVIGGAYFPEINKALHIRNDQWHTCNVRWYTAVDYGKDMLHAGLFWVDEEGFARLEAEIAIAGLLISEACEEIRELELKCPEKVYMRPAPKDLWNGNQETGKSAADIFAQNGIALSLVHNGREAGCYNMREWFKQVKRKDPQTGDVYDSAYLTISPNCPVTYRHLTLIQRDVNNSNVYADQPHNLTHAVDMLRYFCMARPRSNKKIVTKPKRLYDELVKVGKQRGNTTKTIKGRKYR